MKKEISSILKPNWITPKQLEQEYNISITHQNLLRTKQYYVKYPNAIQIPFSKIGNRVYYSRKLIEEWLLKSNQQIIVD